MNPMYPYMAVYEIHIGNIVPKTCMPLRTINVYFSHITPTGVRDSVLPLLNFHLFELHNGKAFHKRDFMWK